MFVLKSKYNDLLSDKEHLEYRFNNDKIYYADQIKRLQNKIKDLENKVADLYDEELEQSNFEFDFVETRAFSIERVTRNNRNETVIGYFESGKETPDEWFLSCSYKQHQKLAEQFRRTVLKRP